METTTVLWVLYAFILPQLGILSTGKELIFSKVFHSVRKNEESADNLQTCGDVPYDRSSDTKDFLSTIDGKDVVNDDTLNSNGRVSKASKTKFIKLAIFVDSAFYKRYQAHYSTDPDGAIIRRVHRILGQASKQLSHETLDVTFKLNLVKLEILKPGMSAPSMVGRYFATYLHNFCDWQKALNPIYGASGHWDHAVLITGISSDGGGIYHDTLAGRVVEIGNICQTDSCSICTYVSSGIGDTLAHEIAHSLGVYHDGDYNNCERGKYFMSLTIDRSKLNWSRCSNNYFNNLISSGRAWCLANHNEGYGLQPLKYKLPNISEALLTLDEQCKLKLGPSYYVFQDEQPPFNDVCRELWCRSEADSDEPKSADKALDGSSCGENMHCMEGSCRRIHSGQNP